MKVFLMLKTNMVLMELQKPHKFRNMEIEGKGKKKTYTLLCWNDSLKIRENFGIYMQEYFIIEIV